MNILDTIFSYIFPANCLGCRKPGVEICEDCINSSPQAERETENWIYPIFDYRHPFIKKSVWLLKYKGKFRVAKAFAPVLYQHILEELSDLALFENFKSPILIPIPLSKKRKRERGFNQSEVICKKIIELDESQNLDFKADVLIKKRETTHQAHIKDRKDRLNNLIDSFDVINPDEISGRNIILVDDVTTTGATLKEAKKVLKKYGAKKVIAFTLAH